MRTLLYHYGAPYEVDFGIARGLDYYTDMVTLRDVRTGEQEMLGLEAAIARILG